MHYYFVHSPIPSLMPSLPLSNLLLIILSNPCFLCGPAPNVIRLLPVIVDPLSLLPALLRVVVVARSAVSVLVLLPDGPLKPLMPLALLLDLCVDAGFSPPTVDATRSAIGVLRVAAGFSPLNHLRRSSAVRVSHVAAGFSPQRLTPLFRCSPPRCLLALIQFCGLLI